MATAGRCLLENGIKQQSCVEKVSRCLQASTKFESLHLNQAFALSSCKIASSSYFGDRLREGWICKSQVRRSSTPTKRRRDCTCLRSSSSKPAGYSGRPSDSSQSRTFPSNQRRERAGGQVSTSAVAEAVGRELHDKSEDDILNSEPVEEPDIPAFDWKAHWYAVGVVQVSPVPTDVLQWVKTE
jgi:hypothetical protein